MLSKKIPVQKIKQNLLNPNELSPDNYNKLKENIERTGQYPSLIVLQQKDEYLLLDGHGRLQVLKDLNHQEVWCEIWQLDDADANLLLATLNRLRGTDDVQKRARLIGELYHDFEGDKEFLSRLLPESEQALKSLLKMSSSQMEETMDSIEDQRGLVEEQLKQIVDPEEAEKMAKSFKNVDDGQPKLTFTFDDLGSYAVAVKFFGRKPNVKKLLRLIRNR